MKDLLGSAGAYLLEATREMLPKGGPEFLPEALQAFILANMPAIVARAREMQEAFMIRITADTEEGRAAKKLMSAQVWGSIRKRQIAERAARDSAAIDKELAETYHHVLVVDDLLP